MPRAQPAEAASAEARARGVPLPCAGIARRTNIAAARGVRRSNARGVRAVQMSQGSHGWPWQSVGEQRRPLQCELSRCQRLRPALAARREWGPPEAGGGCRLGQGRARMQAAQQGRYLWRAFWSHGCSAVAAPLRSLPRSLAPPRPKTLAKGTSDQGPRAADLARRKPRPPARMPGALKGVRLEYVFM